MTVQTGREVSEQGVRRVGRHPFHQEFLAAHAQGQGSTAEASGDQALVDQEDGRNIGSQTHGASSNIFKSIATITATSAYTVIEHGVFNQTSVTGDYLLDRTKLGTEFTVATDDEVEWTYELTINTET